MTGPSSTSPVVSVRRQRIQTELFSPKEELANLLRFTRNKSLDETELKDRLNALIKKIGADKFKSLFDKLSLDDRIEIRRLIKNPSDVPPEVREFLKPLPKISPPPRSQRSQDLSQIMRVAKPPIIQPASASVASAINASPLLSLLPKGFERDGKEVSYSIETRIIKPNKKANKQVYVILEGKVKVEILDSDNEVVKTFEVDSGIVGERSVIENTPTNARVTALPGAKLLVIPANKFLAHFNKAGNSQALKSLLTNSNGDFKFSADVADAVLTNSRLALCRPGESIVIKGGQTDYVYLVIDGGKLDVHDAFDRLRVDGKAAEVKAGEPVGEMEVMDGNKGQAAYSVVNSGDTDVILLKIPKSKFVELMYVHRDFKRYIRGHYIKRKASIAATADPAAELSKIGFKYTFSSEVPDHIQTQIREAALHIYKQLKAVNSEINPRSTEVKELLKFICSSLEKQQIDNPLKYVSHGADHSVNTYKLIQSLINSSADVQTAVREGFGSLEKGKILAQLVALFHDVGYPKVTELAQQGQDVPKFMHQKYSADLVKEKVPYAALKALIPNLTQAEYDMFITAIEHHGSDSLKPKDVRAGRPFRYGAMRDNPFTLLMRLADNIDMIQARLNSIQSDPMFLKALEEMYTKAEVIDARPLNEATKERLIGNANTEIINKYISLIERKLATINSELRRNPDTKERIRLEAEKEKYTLMIDILKGCNHESFPHFISVEVAANISVEIKNGKIFLKLIYETPMQFVPKALLEFQVNRLKGSIDSVIFSNNTSVEIELDGETKVAKLRNGKVFIDGAEVKFSESTAHIFDAICKKISEATPEPEVKLIAPPPSHAAYTKASGKLPETARMKKYQAARAKIIQDLIAQYSVDHTGAETLGSFYVEMAKKKGKVSQIIVNISLKWINDKYNKPGGNQVLKEVLARIEQCLEKEGVEARVYRMGANYVVDIISNPYNKDLDLLIGGLQAEMDSAFEIRIGNKTESISVKTYIGGYQHSNIESFGSEGLIRWVKWFVYQLNSIPIPDITSQVEAGKSYEIKPDNVPIEIKYSIQKPRKSSLQIQIESFLKETIGNGDSELSRLADELHQKGFIEVDSKLHTYEALKTLMDNGFFERGTWSMAALDGNRFSSFRNKYGFLGSQILEAVIKGKIGGVAASYLASHNCILIRHGAFSEEFYIIGPHSEAEMAKIVEGFTRRLQKPFLVEIEKKALMETEEGKAFLEKNKGKLTERNGILYVSVELLKGEDVTVTAAVGILDNADPKGSFDKINNLSEVAKSHNPDRISLVVRSSLTPQALFNAFGIECESPEKFEKVAFHNPDKFRNFVIELWKAGYKNLDAEIEDATEITDTTLDNILEKSKKSVVEIDAGQFKDLRAFQDHLDGLPNHKTIIYRVGSLTFSKADARKWLAGQEKLAEILLKAARSQEDINKEALKGVMEALKSEKIKGLAHKSKDYFSSRTPSEIELSNGKTAKVTIIDKGKLEIEVEGIKVEVAAKDIEIIAQGKKAESGIIQRAIRANKTIAPETVRGLVLENLARLSNVLLDVLPDRNISMSLIEVNGNPAEIKARLLTKLLPVKIGPDRYLGVKISIIDFRTLVYGQEGSPEYNAALANIEKAISEQVGVDAKEAKARTKELVEEIKMKKISANAQMYFQNLAEQKGLDILKTEAAKIDPADPKFDAKLQKAFRKAQLAMIKFNMRAYELMLDKVAEKGFNATALSETELKVIFSDVAVKVDGEISGLTEEQYEADIKAAQASLTKKLSTRWGRFSAFADYANTGAPKASVGSQFALAGFNAAKGGAMGAALSAPVSIVRQLLTTGSISGFETLKEVLHSGYGWAKFEAMTSIARSMGMGAHGASAVAIGLPHLWELSAAPAEQRGVIFSMGAVNLGVFMGASSGISWMLARVAPKMPGWAGKGITLGGAMLTSMLTSLGMEIGLESSPTLRAIVNNPTTRALGNLGAAASTPADIYFGGRLATHILTKAGAGRAAFLATRLASGILIVATVVTYENENRMYASLFGSLKDVVNGGKPLTYRYADNGKTLLFGPDDTQVYIGNEGEGTAEVYYQVGQFLYEKGYLEADPNSSDSSFGLVPSIAGTPLFDIFSNPEAYKKALMNPTFRVRFAQQVQKGLRKFKKDLKEKGIILDEEINPKFRKDDPLFVNKAYTEYKVQQAVDPEKARFKALVLNLKNHTESFISEQKRKLRELKESAKKEYLQSLNKQQIKLLKDLKQSFELKGLDVSWCKTVHIIQHMTKLDMSKAEDRAKLIAYAERIAGKKLPQEVGKHIVEAAKSIKARYEVFATVATKQYQHVEFEINNKLKDFHVQLPPEVQKGYFDYLRDNGVPANKRNSYLGEKKFTKFFTKYLFKVKGPQETRKRLADPSELEGQEKANVKAAFDLYCQKNRVPVSDRSFSKQNEHYQKFIKEYVEGIYTNHAPRLEIEARAALAKQVSSKPIFFADIPGSEARGFRKYLEKKYSDLYQQSIEIEMGRNYNTADVLLGTGVARHLFSKPKQ